MRRHHYPGAGHPAPIVRTLFADAVPNRQPRSARSCKRSSLEQGWTHARRAQVPIRASSREGGTHFVTGRPFCHRCTFVCVVRPPSAAVVCGYCGTPLTACWAKGKYSLYPYYFCPKRGCAGYSQTVRRETIEAQFETILRSMQPSENVFAAARAMFKTLWSRRLASQVETRRTLESERSKIER